MKSNYSKASYESLVASNNKLKETVENLFRSLVRIQEQKTPSALINDKNYIECFFVLERPVADTTKQIPSTREIEKFEDYDLPKHESALPSPGFANRTLGNNAAVWGILCVKLSDQKMKQTIETVVQAQMGEIPFIPVFIMVATAIAPLVRCGLAFEILPTSLADVETERPNWVKYRRKRLDLLIAKYRITRIVTPDELRANINTK
jgi:hypothetical protein